MKRALSFLLALCVVLTLAAVSAAPAGAATSATTQVQTLYAGRNTAVGTVSIWNDATNLFVKYATSGGWELVETHLAVATSAAGIPQTKSGNPVPGRFADSTVHDPPVTQYTCTVPISGDWRYPIADLKIAAHAAVHLLVGDHQVIASESAWAAGTPFPGANWATYFNYARDLSVAEACSVIQSAPDLVILDVRSVALYNGGHIANAMNITYSSAFKTNPSVSGLDKSKTYLVYCGSGNNGARAAADLRDLGFTTVYNLAGGYAAWTAAGGCPAP